MLKREICLYACRGRNVIAQQISAVFVLFSFWASPSSGKLTISSHSRRRRPLTLGIFWVAQSSKLYLDDILISCRDISDHQSRVCQVLQTLLVSQGQYVGVHPKANSVEKTSWYLRRLYCAQVICTKGNERSVAKVAGGVSNWVIPGIQEWRQAGGQVSYHLSYSCVPKTHLKKISSSLFIHTNVRHTHTRVCCLTVDATPHDKHGCAGLCHEYVTR